MKKTRPSLLWLVALGLLFILAPLFFLWWFRGAGAAVARPIGLFMPDRPSAALCLRQPLAAWNRHWSARKGPAPEEALKAILEASGTWDRWVKKHGELQSQMRVKLFQEVFFRTLGDESWLVFGEWGGAHPGEGETGLVAFIRSNTTVLPRVGPLLELLLDDYSLKSSTCEGETVYQYEDARLGRCLTLCQVGGWVCISMRRRDSGPLPEIIRRVKAADGATSHPLATASILAVTSATQTLACDWRPVAFWAQLDAFNNQRGRKNSKKSREAIAAWKEKMGGIEAVTARQEGDSLLGMRMEARGPRLAALNRLASDGINGASVAGMEASAGTQPGETELASLEFSKAAGAVMLPRDLMAGLKDAAWFDLIMPGVRGRLAAAFATGGGNAPNARIGLAAYTSPAQILPRMDFWDDHTSRSLVLKRVGNQSGTPLACAGLNFQELSAGLDKIPTLLMKKKAQKKLKTWKSTVRALALAVGGAEAQIDGEDDRWVMKLRTP